jgi:hypothetical protein
MIELGNGNWDKPITITVQTLVSLGVACMVAGMLTILRSSMFGYFAEKKRKEYPIE